MIEDSRLDHLISRRLDGELTAEESLELDKILIRDPDARRDMEQAARIDALSSSFFDEICSRPVMLSARDASRRSTRRLGWFILGPVAAAACLLLGLNGVGTSSPVKPPARNPTNRDTVASRLNEPVPALANWEQPYRTRGTDLDLYGVYDQSTGKFYMLQVERTQTVEGSRRVLHPGQNVRLASDDM